MIHSRSGRRFLSVDRRLACCTASPHPARSRRGERGGERHCRPFPPAGSEWTVHEVRCRINWKDRTQAADDWPNRQVTSFPIPVCFLAWILGGHSLLRKLISTVSLGSTG